MPKARQSFVKRLLRWRFLFVVNLVIIVGLSLSLGREVVRDKTIEHEIALMEQQAEALAAENLAMSELKSALQSESYIEREARLKLGMKRPGESVLVIQEENDSVRKSAGEMDSNDPYNLIIGDDDSFEQVANPTRWWYYFFNKSAFEQITS